MKQRLGNVIGEGRTKYELVRPSSRSKLNAFRARQPPTNRPPFQRRLRISPRAVVQACYPAVTPISESLSGSLS